MEEYGIADVKKNGGTSPNLCADIHNLTQLTFTCSKSRIENYKE